jgi:hypothetical protein
MKMEIDVPTNIMKFLEAISNLTGRSVKEILEDGAKSECENILGCWAPELCSVEELRKRYDF